MKKEIILIGGGGHCRSCIDVIEQENRFKIAGIVDVPEKLGEKICGYKIIGNDDDLLKMVKLYKHFLITIGQIKTADKRVKKFNSLKEAGAVFPTIISPFAYVSKHASLDEGTIVLHKAAINVGVKIGKNCIINAQSDVEHDVAIGHHCHISTACVVNGDAHLGNRIFIGSNAVVAQGVSIHDDVIVGAGAVVIKSIKQSGLYFGNPCRIVKKTVAPATK